MGKITTIVCTNCGTEKQKPKREVDRQLRKGRTLFFCSLSCAASHGNGGRRAPRIMKPCAECGARFPTIGVRWFKSTHLHDSATLHITTGPKHYRPERMKIWRGRHNYAKSLSATIPSIGMAHLHAPTRAYVGSAASREGWLFGRLSQEVLPPKHPPHRINHMQKFRGTPKHRAVDLTNPAPPKIGHCPSCSKDVPIVRGRFKPHLTPGGQTCVFSGFAYCSRPRVLLD